MKSGARPGARRGSRGNSSGGDGRGRCIRHPDARRRRLRRSGLMGSGIKRCEPVALASRPGRWCRQLGEQRSQLVAVAIRRPRSRRDRGLGAARATAESPTRAAMALTPAGAQSQSAAAQVSKCALAAWGRWPHRQREMPRVASRYRAALEAAGATVLEYGCCRGGLRVVRLASGGTRARRPASRATRWQDRC